MQIDSLTDGERWHIGFACAVVKGSLLKNHDEYSLNLVVNDVKVFPFPFTSLSSNTHPPSTAVYAVET